MRRFVPVLLTSVLLLTAAVPLHADRTVSFSGRVTTSVQIIPTTEPWQLNIVVSGTGSISHFGNTLVTIVQHQDDPIGNTVTSTVFEMMAENGDVLFAHFTMDVEFIASPPGALFSVAFHGTFHVDGGTGRFEGATGSVPFKGTAVNYPPDNLHQYAWGIGEFSFKGGTLTLKRP